MPSLKFEDDAAVPYHLSLLATVTIVFIGAPLFLVFSRMVYNLYFHPLRKYPGPFLARATGWWYSYHLARGNVPYAIRDAHEKYGDVVRVSPVDLDYVDGRAWKDVWGHRNGVPENEKDKRHFALDDMTHPHILASDRNKHAILRRLMSNGFSDKALREQHPIILHYVNLLIAKLQQKTENGENIVNLVDWYNFTTFDVIGHLAFDESFNCLSGSDYHPWIRILFSTIHVAIEWASINRLTMGYLNRFLKRTLVPDKLQKDRAANAKLIDEMLMRRLDREPDYTDLMQNMITARENGKLELGDLHSNSRVLIVAGSETTATTLSGATWFLLNNPHAYNRLVKEVRDAFKRDEDITFDAVNKLPYLLAVLDESLRMFPPVAGPLIRVTPPEGAMVCGEWIPGGTSISITQLAMHYSESNWVEPKSFRPERFLRSGAAHRDLASKKASETMVDTVEIAEKNEWARDKRDSLQPFSVGPRNCIGRNLAYIEMRIILAKMLFHFDLEMAEGNSDPVTQRIYVLWEKGPLNAKLIPVAR